MRIQEFITAKRVKEPLEVIEENFCLDSKRRRIGIRYSISRYTTTPVESADRYPTQYAAADMGIRYAAEPTSLRDGAPFGACRYPTLFASIDEARAFARKGIAASRRRALKKTS